MGRIVRGPQELPVGRALSLPNPHRRNPSPHSPNVVGPQRDLQFPEHLRGLLNSPLKLGAKNKGSLVGGARASANRARRPPITGLSRSAAPTTSTQLPGRISILRPHVLPLHKHTGCTPHGHVQTQKRHTNASLHTHTHTYMWTKDTHTFKHEHPGYPCTCAYPYTSTGVHRHKIHTHTHACAQCAHVYIYTTKIHTSVHIRAQTGTAEEHIKVHTQGTCSPLYTHPHLCTHTGLQKSSHAQFLQPPQCLQSAGEKNREKGGQIPRGWASSLLRLFG